MCNDFLNQLNTIQKELHPQLQKFEDKFCKDTGIEIENISIYTETYPAYHDYTYQIIVRCYYTDEWNTYWNAKFCKEFNVVLTDFRIKYTTSKQYLNSANYFEYVYSPKGFTGLLYCDRMKDFYYAPINYSTINISTSEKVRVLTHRILNKLRELDNLDLDYEEYIDKDSLFLVLEQLDCCLRNKEKLKK